MEVEPVGLPAALKAWHNREPEPLLTMHCRADPGCGIQVGAVYRSPNGIVVESRTSTPQDRPHQHTRAIDLDDLAKGLGVTGLLEDFGDLAAGEPSPQSVIAQIDLLYSELYWHDPVPVCPEHGALLIDRAAMTEAVRDGHDRYEVVPV